MCPSQRTRGGAFRDQPLLAAQNVDLRRDRRRAKTRDPCRQLQLVVETCRRVEYEIGLRDNRVDSALDHLLPRPDSRTPQLCEGHVEVEQVVRVEHDPLRVALAIAHAELVYERGRHGANTLAVGRGTGSGPGGVRRH